jgi:hypothetical protein
VLSSKYVFEKIHNRNFAKNEPTTGKSSRWRQSRQIAMKKYREQSQIEKEGGKSQGIILFRFVVKEANLF